MTDDQKKAFLVRINKALEKKNYAEECKRKWDDFYYQMDSNMRFIVAYARNMGDELLRNEMFKYEAVEEALTSSLFSMGYRPVYDDDRKAIKIVKIYGK